MDLEFDLNKPLSREEHYLANIAELSETKPIKPQSRVEAYLDYICEHGGSGGSDPYARAMIAKNYSTTKQYVEGDFAIKNNKLYKAIAETTGEFDPTKWTETSVDSELKNGGKTYSQGHGILINGTEISTDQETVADVDYVDDSITATMLYINQEIGSEHAGRTAGDTLLSGMITDTYDPDETYDAGELAIHNLKLYKAKVETTGEFDDSDWEQVDIEALLNDSKTKATWGNINGSLTNQTDLNQVLQTKASLVNGRIPIQQMPEFVVADVVEVETYEDLPATGETNTLYHVILTDSTYRWVGNHYLLISQQSNYYSLLIDTNIATMGALKDAVDSVNEGGDHVFFDLHQLVNEGYVCTVHFWDETVSGTVHHYCEINDLLNDRLYGIKQEWTSEQLVSAYCSGQGLMYDIKRLSVAGTALTNDRGFVDIPKATDSTLGVVRVRATDGITINDEGQIIINRASDAQIQSKTETKMPIVPNNLDKAVMEGLGNNALTWTDAYKLSARTTIGTGVRITDTTDPQGDVEMIDMETVEMVEAIAATSTHNEVATAKAVYDTMTAAIAAAKPQIIYH